MSSSNSKAIIISGAWASILTTVAGAIIISGLAYAWNTNADLAVLQRDVKQIKDANLDVRMSVMEQTVKGMADTMNRVENKLDKLLERR